MTLDLTDDEARGFASTFGARSMISPTPFAPRLDPLKSILAKLELPASQLEPLQSPRQGLRSDPQARKVGR